ncbi:MAG: anti-sigma F factor [Clostridia bacterium]|nr:anti-sigma F factor [Clostridia bacterium]
MENIIKFEFVNKSCNENLARIVAAAFASQLDPTCEERSEIKTAISEAVTNAIIHGYEDSIGMVRLDGRIVGNTVEFIVSDKGCGIADIHQAMEPLYTGKPELERSGLGFTIMESFMDKIEVKSKPGMGTSVKMKKVISVHKNSQCMSQAEA